MQVVGTGSALPGAPLPTDELIARFSTHLPAGAAALARRIARRLAIDTRHVARDLLAPVEAARAHDCAPQIAARAIQAALASTARGLGDIDFLIGHTTTPHTLLPSNTAWTADALGYLHGHVELRQACTGFAAATLLARGLLADSLRCVAIVGSETGSLFFDPRAVDTDPGQLVNLVQMGDGAGAIVLARVTDPSASTIGSVYFGSDGLHRAPGITLASGPVGATGIPLFRHDFADIRTNGMDLLRASLAAAARSGVAIGATDWFVPHQANGRMAALCEQAFGMPAERVYCCAAQTGNVGSASIWIALDRLRRSGRLAPGDRVLILGAEASKYLYGGFLYVHGTT